MDNRTASGIVAARAAAHPDFPLAWFSAQHAVHVWIERYGDARIHLLQALDLFAVLDD